MDTLPPSKARNMNRLQIDKEGCVLFYNATTGPLPGLHCQASALLCTYIKYQLDRGGGGGKGREVRRSYPVQ